MIYRQQNLCFIVVLWQNSSVPTARQKRWYEGLVCTMSGRPSTEP
jgi:hypothetical protein